MKEITSFSEADTKKTGSDMAFFIACNKGGAKILCLKGCLGAGKTVFVKGFSEKLGIDPCLVKSPTYTYMRKYASEKEKINIYHFDYYRLTESNEIVENELLEIIENGNNIIIIEWPEKIEHVLPKSRIDISIEIAGNKENSRKITIFNE